MFNKTYGLFDFKGASTKSCKSVKKRKFVMKIIFSDDTESSSKKLAKMISADVKANIKQEVYIIVIYKT